MRGMRKIRRWKEKDDKGKRGQSGRQISERGRK